jgi:DsbC/DsbD-like thiol-disulfide interchange protein
VTNSQLPAVLGFALACAAPVCGAQEAVQLWEEVYVRVRPGATVQTVFHLSVADGHFLVGRGLGTASLQPLTLTMQVPDGISVGTPMYPQPASMRLPGTATDSPVYSGTVTIVVPITVSEDGDWQSRVLQGRLDYQVCTETVCAAPASAPVSLEVERAPDKPR